MQRVRPAHLPLRLAGAVFVMMLLLAGCTASESHSTADGSMSATGAASSGGRCDSTPIVVRPVQGPEVHGSGHGATLYGQIMAASGPRLRVGEDIKIVWRMTGRGPLHLRASKDGRTAPLTFGPERHSGSNYDRPGDEWGAGYRFPSSGCWRLQAMRSTAYADVWLRIAAR